MLLAEEQTCIVLKLKVIEPLVFNTAIIIMPGF